MDEKKINHIDEPVIDELDGADESTVDRGISVDDLYYKPGDMPRVTTEYHPGSTSENGGTITFNPKSEKKGKFLVPFIIGVLFALALSFALSLWSRGHRISDEAFAEYMYLRDNFGKYSEIIRLIEQNPLAEKTPSILNDEDLKELVASIGDPYAEYFTPEEYEEFSKQYISDYVGVGILITQGEDKETGELKIVVLSVFADGPAETGGMLAGDIILSIDGHKPTDTTDAVSHITGEAGTSLTITVERDGEVMDLPMTRENVEQQSVAYNQDEDDSSIGYVQILTFRKGTADDFESAIQDLQNQGCTKFIIDLRDNGGGLTDESIKIADYLLPECQIMSEKNKKGDEKVYNSKASAAGLDMVLLVNENTASASEILAGALQDNNACEVIGSKTYGKGVTQLSHRFMDGSAIKMTVTEYFRPSGKTVHGIGITPDYEVEADKAEDKAREVLGDE